MKCRSVFMPHADHRVTLRRAAALLPALALAASPAAAERVQSRMAVSAIVLSGCLVSTRDPGAAAISCTSGGRWNIAVEQRRAGPPADREERPAAAPPPPALTMVTVSY